VLIGIPIYDGVNVLDVTGPYEVLSWAGFDVQLFAQKPGLVACRGGISIQATGAFKQAPPLMCYGCRVETQTHSLGSRAIRNGPISTSS